MGSQNTLASWVSAPVAPPHWVFTHGSNIPSIDLAAGRVVCACLDGCVCVAAAAASPHPTRLVQAAVMHDEITADGEGEWVPARPRQMPRDPRTPHGIRPFWSRLSDNMWNACWVPLNSIGTASPEKDSVINASTAALAMTTSNDIVWLSTSAALSGEIVRNSVLPFFTAIELLRVMQLLSTEH